MSILLLLTANKDEIQKKKANLHILVKILEEKVNLPQVP